MSSSKVIAARGVAGVTNPVKTRKKRKPPVPPTRGRRSRKDTLAQAYPSPRRRKDTGAWVWSYTDPFSKECRIARCARSVFGRDCVPRVRQVLNVVHEAEPIACPASCGRTA